uniref:Uncharacterized protein n=1 Tax=Setaria italica TaxID=4555 RepID=K4A2R4_SETIT
MVLVGLGTWLQFCLLISSLCIYFFHEPDPSMMHAVPFACQMDNAFGVLVEMDFLLGVHFGGLSKCVSFRLYAFPH